MATACDHSILTIPNDAGYAPLVGRYAADIASRFGFSDKEARIVAEAAAAAVKAVLAYSFEPSENVRIEVGFERIPEGLQITLHDQGLPLAPVPERGAQAKPEPDFPLSRLEALVDEVRLNNRGREGKEIVLIKHLKTRSVQDYFDACVLEPFPDKIAGAPAEMADIRCEVRSMAPEESAEVSKIIYKTYGYSYPNDYVYYPERIAALNLSGRIHSAVAVADDNRLVGHCALQFSPAHPEIAELSQGAVIPQYRGHGCFTRLTAHLLKVARRHRLRGIFGRAVTNHPYSQTTALQQGFKDCGVLLGMVPSTARFRGISESSGRRTTMMLQYLSLAPSPLPTVYLPRRHHPIARRIYAEWDHHPDIREGPEAGFRTKRAVPSNLAIEVRPALSFAAIGVRRYGNGFEAEMQAAIKKLCLRKIEIIHLKLPLDDPLTGRIAPAMEALGFFFAGILPGGLPASDALILQYLNNVPPDYESIKVVSEMGRELVDYVRRQDHSVLAAL